MGRGTKRRVRLAGTSLLLAVVVLVLAGASSCPPWIMGLTLNHLRQLLATPEWGAIDVERKPGIRVHFYPELPNVFLHGNVLPEGTVVEPHTPLGSASRKLVCGSQRGCVLVYVDTDPWAHYAHRVVIALWELDTFAFQRPIIAEWWPLVDGEPVLDTVEGRERVDYRWLGERVLLADPVGSWGATYWDSPVRRQAVPMSTPEPGPGGPLPTPTPTPTPCAVWAVVVNGDEDLSDSFDEDTEGMYEVLKGLGVPEDQIYYLSPHHQKDPAPHLVSAVTCQEPTLHECPTPDLEDNVWLPTGGEYRYRTSFCNLMNVLTRVLPDRIAASGNPCKELLFFMSTHGKPMYLQCGESELVCGVDLQQWLAKTATTCSTLTIVIEACQSGGLIDDLEAAPAGSQQVRRIFTSTDEYGDSHMDVDWEKPPGITCGSSDWIKDPNPGDSGSETIWGYIEAFGTGTADIAVQDGEISFAEAVDYAIANDVMTLNNCNKPQVTPTPAPSGIPHCCAAESEAPDLAIGITAQVTQAAASATQPVSSRSVTVELEVANVTADPASGPVPSASVKVYWAKGPQATWPGDFYARPPAQYLDHQIGETVLVTGLSPGEVWDHKVKWEVGSSFTAGDQLVLVATVDSPRDPVPVSPTPALLTHSQFVASTNNAASTVVVVPQAPQTPAGPVGCASMR